MIRLMATSASWCHKNSLTAPVTPGWIAEWLAWLLVFAAAGWIGLSILVGGIYPSAVQGLQVSPNELSLEKPQIAANMKAMMLTTPVEGYIACCEALSTLDQRELLPRIKSPTLVIAGRHDMSTTIADAEFMRSRIPGASMTILDAAHISNVEQPHAFTDALVGFLTQR